MVHGNQAHGSGLRERKDANSRGSRCAWAEVRHIGCTRPPWSLAGTPLSPPSLLSDLSVPSVNTVGFCGRTSWCARFRLCSHAAFGAAAYPLFLTMCMLQGYRSIPNSFHGNELVTWLVSSCSCASREQAVEVGDMMLRVRCPMGFRACCVVLSLRGALHPCIAVASVFGVLCVCVIRCRGARESVLFRACAG